MPLRTKLIYNIMELNYVGAKGRSVYKCGSTDAIHLTKLLYNITMQPSYSGGKLEDEGS